MSRCIRNAFSAIFLALVFASIVVAMEPREKLDLDGIWSFATDPDERGEREQWFTPSTKLPAMPLPGYAPEANGTIRVPGVWDNQGYGTETEKVRHNFVGKGWYKRQLTIPVSWSGRRTFLAITGVQRTSKVWVDRHFLGEHVGSLSSLEYDITPFVTPGQTATITIQVDSKQRWEVDALFGAFSLADYMDISWGGIWGHVFLESRSNVWLDAPYVRSEIATSTCKVMAVIHGDVKLADSATLEVFDRDQKCVGRTVVRLAPNTADGIAIAADVVVPEAQLWTPDTPTLYTARLSLCNDDRILDVQQSRFGMREFTTDGYRILLNGKRIGLLGFGDDHIYPKEMAMPSNKAVFLERLKTIRSYGFNHVRHHSTIMPPEYYDACDEIGIITTAEFPIVYEPFIPGSGDRWKANVKPGTDPKPALDTYHREWAAAITRHRNHPSILCWVMGNELYPDFPIRYSFRDIAKKLDPARMFLDSDGVDPALLADPKRDRPTVAIYDIQFSECSDPIMNLGKFRMQKPVKPVLSHEAGNYVTFSRPDVIDHFQSNIKPFWLTAGKAKLEKLGLLQVPNDWATKSERLYALLHKYNLESLRKNPYISGYHWWLFQDYWTSSNGIVDHHFRPKTITKEEVLKFNSNVVLLQDGLQRTYRSRASLALKLLASNLSPNALQGDLVCEVKAGDRTILRKERRIEAVPQGDVSSLATIDVRLPTVDLPTRLSVIATLHDHGKTYRNDWTTWLYPAEVSLKNVAVSVFADDAQQRRFPAWPIKTMPANGELPSEAVYITGWLDERLVDALRRGASAIVVDGGGGFLKSYPLTFRTSWWKAGERREENNTGTFVYDHGVTKAMAPDGWCDDGWFHLVDGGCKFDLEKAPNRPEVLIRALNSLAMPADEAILFQVGIGKGCLIVSGLNHRASQGCPENDWILAKLIEHAATFPKPNAVWPVSFLKVAEAAPDGCLPGFRRLVANQGETASWYSDREDSATTFVCRQDAVGHAVSWETPPLKNLPAGDRVTIVFAGGLGFASEPKTAGFALDINGHEAIRFDLPEPHQWRSSDQRIELNFVARRTVSVDQFGQFRLTMPRDQLKPGEPCRLTVRSLGTGSRRWFALYPYLDVR
jgi:hypothetical protein